MPRAFRAFLFVRVVSTLLVCHDSLISNRENDEAHLARKRGTNNIIYMVCFSFSFPRFVSSVSIVFILFRFVASLL